MKPWQFGRPKGPGFGISAHFYLTIVSPSSTLPTPAEIVNPTAIAGAVEGFCVPLSSSDKSLLTTPIRRGAFAVASPDRKTVLKLLTLPKEESGFNPELFAQSDLASMSSPEVVARVRGTWFVLQLAFESHDARVYPAVRFFLRVAKRIGELTDGVVADPISQRYTLPEDVLFDGTTDFQLDVRDVATVRFRHRSDGLHCFTLGMQKFSLPELEVYGCDQEVEPLAVRLLLGACQSALRGKPLREGGRIGAPSMPLEVRPGGLDPTLRKDVACFELLPPTQHTVSEALIAWAQGVDAQDNGSFA